MNEIKVSNINLIECADCKNYAKKTLKNKIINKYESARACIKGSKNLIVRYKFEIFKQLPKSWAKSGEACVKKYEKKECRDEEHAIIIINNKNPDDNRYIFESGIDILAEYFLQSSIKFKIYNCHNPQDFYESIKLSKAPNLWIFGHGTRHRISFGNETEDKCPFCKIAETDRRSFIAQFHCCNGTGKTLWEYLSDKPGIFSEGFRDSLQNRDDIEKWINKDKQK